MWEESEEKAQEIFLNKPTTRKAPAEDHFLQQKMHNLEIMTCNADCSHSYAERKKILQMKGMKLYYCGIMENTKEILTLPAKGSRRLAC